MNQVRVSKKDLLEKLYSNKEIHVNEFKLMHARYQNDVIKGLKVLLKEAKKYPNHPVTEIILNEPKSYEEDYDNIIGLLEMSIDEDFLISESDYKKYVLNIWNWTNNFEFSKSTYEV